MSGSLDKSFLLGMHSLSPALFWSFSAACILLFRKVNIPCSEYSLINIVIDCFNGTGNFFFMSRINVGNRLSLLKKRCQKTIQFIKLLTWQGNPFPGSLQLLHISSMSCRCPVIKMWLFAFVNTTTSITDVWSTRNTFTGIWLVSVTMVLTLCFPTTTTSNIPKTIWT